MQIFVASIMQYCYTCSVTVLVLVLMQYITSIHTDAKSICGPQSHLADDF